MKTLLLLIFLTCCSILPWTSSVAKDSSAVPLAVPTTFCNPLNLDYDFELHKGDRPNHRSTADPVCFMYKGKYLLFATNQEGYWWSDNDMATWNFVAHNFKTNANDDQVCAPGAWPTKEGVLFLPCFSKDVTMPLYRSTDPASGTWTEAVSSFPIVAWDPSLFEDDDGRLYLYWGSSNLYPLYGVELDTKTFTPLGKTVELLHLDQKKHGWEQFGENNQHGKMDPFIEGAWMNKFHGRYYLQYGAPGTEFNVYGDGVYTSDNPLGPFKYEAFNPFSWKPTGFARGAGHGATFKDRFDNLWHVATMVISVKNTFERRIGMFPAGVDKDGVLFANTAFGDYPQFLANNKRNQLDTFTGWMLLSYRKNSWSSAPGTDTSLAFDEDIKTYWTAPDGEEGQFLAVDLGRKVDVRAIQINYADEKVEFRKKQIGVKHRYQILESRDNEAWNLLVDKSKNDKDVPHDYVELSAPISTRYLKLVNLEMPTGSFAISDLRVFGSAPGAVPAAVNDFQAVRDKSDRRNISFSWKAIPDAYAYEIRWGAERDKLYGSMLVYDTMQEAQIETKNTRLEGIGSTKNMTYDLHSLNVDSPYYYRIRSIGESGAGEFGEVTEVP